MIWGVTRTLFRWRGIEEVETEVVPTWVIGRLAPLATMILEGEVWGEV
jgi:hypothetical protein